MTTDADDNNCESHNFSNLSLTNDLVSDLNDAPWSNEPWVSTVSEHPTGKYFPMFKDFVFDIEADYPQFFYNTFDSCPELEGAEPGFFENLQNIQTIVNFRVRLDVLHNLVNILNDMYATKRYKKQLRSILRMIH